MSRPTQTLMGQKARKAVLDGVNAIYEPVRRTLGPQAKKALLYRTYNRGSRIVDDGKTVAECQEPKDPFARLAAETFKEMCKKTDAKVGDGTSTTAVIGGKLMNDVYNLLADGTTEFTAKRSGKIGVMTLRKNILESANKVKEEIKKVAKKVETLEELERISTVSVEDEQLGKIIAKMAWEVGVDGFIDTVEGYKGEIETELSFGFRFPAKIAAKAFLNNANRFEMVAVDSPVLLTNYALDNTNEISGVLQKLNAITSKIIIIAPSFSENVLVNMVNATKAGYFMYPVLGPSLRTEQFEDIAVYCGAKFIDKSKGNSLRSIVPGDLGFLGKLIVKDAEAKEDAVATGGKGTKEQMFTKAVEREQEFSSKDGKKTKKKVKTLEERVSTAIAERITTLKAQLIETREEMFKKLLERRIASMASAVGVIRVGDSTQASALYRKLKIEDAVYACKSALRSGYVKGGGLCLKEIAENMPDDDILKPALLAPYEQIQSSVDGGLEIGNEIIDPADAVYYAVEHATSVVANLATVEIITPEMEDVPQGEGEMSIAKAIQEFVVSNKIHLGQIKANEAEMERDRMGGLTIDEKVGLDNG